MTDIDKFLCKIGLHRMKDHKRDFYDFIGHSQVYKASCSCSEDRWLVDTKSWFPFFKVDRNEE
jgi:hypothetical protein